MFFVVVALEQFLKSDTVLSSALFCSRLIWLFGVFILNVSSNCVVCVLFACCIYLNTCLFIASVFIKGLNLQFSNFSFLTVWYPEYPGFVELTWKASFLVYFMELKSGVSSF